ncbi:hypothetical protein BDC45DRAFT_273016 [Circinella umbellata]|nr:hypothetical protein BDC45DRAFT_273016 [Circinella umbellata]
MKKSRDIINIMVLVDRSIRSGSESTRGTNNKRHKRRPHKSTIKPTEIFAQNLSDAVLDANDSDEQEAFVYRDRNSLYPTLPASFQWSANHPDGKRHNTDGDSYYTKPRRPVLRSAVSELPPTAMLRTPAASSFRSSPPPPLPNKYNNNYNKDKNNTKRHHYHHQNYYSTKHKDHDWYPSDADEDAPLLPRYSPNSKRKRRQVYSNSKSNNNNYNNKRKTIALWSLFSACVAMTSMWFMLVFTTALPLSPVEVLELSNVLGSAKELFFDLNVRARNTNFWSIEISHASFSVFASSHVVPTVAEMAINNTSSGMMAAPVEFLGTIYQLDEPLVFQPARFFKPSTTVASSQIQIKNPGKTKGDSGGNERWSLLIHYPYELTIRGVLKYRMIPIIPWAQMHSARICQVSRVDPNTGEISSIPESEKSICDDPSSPIETTVISSTTTTTIASSS